jgi:hypothetical protein
MLWQVPRVTLGSFLGGLSFDSLHQLFFGVVHFKAMVNSAGSEGFRQTLHRVNHLFE